MKVATGLIGFFIVKYECSKNYRCLMQSSNIYFDVSYRDQFLIVVTFYKNRYCINRTTLTNKNVQILAKRSKPWINVLLSPKLINK